MTDRCGRVRQLSRDNGGARAQVRPILKTTIERRIRTKFAAGTSKNEMNQHCVRDHEDEVYGDSLTR